MLVFRARSGLKVPWMLFLGDLVGVSGFLGGVRGKRRQTFGGMPLSRGGGPKRPDVAGGAEFSEGVQVGQNQVFLEDDAFFAPGGRHVQRTVHDGVWLLSVHAHDFFQIDPDEGIVNRHEPEDGVLAVRDALAVSFVDEYFVELLFEEFGLVVSGQDAGLVLLKYFILTFSEVDGQVFDAVFALVVLEEFGGVVERGVAAGVKNDSQMAGVFRQLVL